MKINVNIIVANLGILFINLSKNGFTIYTYTNDNTPQHKDTSKQIYLPKLNFLLV